MQVYNINANNSYSDILDIDNTFYGKYYLYDDILKEYPDFNKGYPSRKVLNKYIINETDYKYIIKSDKYKFYDSNYSKAKLFFKKEWVDYLLSNITKDYINPLPLLKINNLPDFLKNGKNTLRFRGERSRDKLYISLESLANLLDYKYKNLKDSILCGKIRLDKDVHWVMFGFKNKETKKIKKVPYFTYSGFLTYIFISRSPKASEITMYCETVLFASMLGTSEQKAETITTQILKTENDFKTLKTKLGIDIIHYKEVVNTLGRYSCLYLLILKETDHSYIVKYGRTEDLTTRLSQHYKDFGNVYVKFCRYIDECKLTEAENELKEHFTQKYTQVDTYNGKNRLELFEIKKCNLLTIKKLYNNLSIKYGDKVKNINKGLKETENSYTLEINNLQNQLNIKDLECKSITQGLQNQLNIKDLEIASLKKDLNGLSENYNLKLQLAELKLQLLQK